MRTHKIFFTGPSVWKARRSRFIFQVRLAVCPKSFFVWQMPSAGLRTLFVPFQISFFTLHFSLYIFPNWLCQFCKWKLENVEVKSSKAQMSKSNYQLCIAQAIMSCKPKRRVYSRIVVCNYIDYTFAPAPCSMSSSKILASFMAMPLPARNMMNCSLE